MQPSPSNASTSLPRLAGISAHSPRREDLAYQAMIVAAMLLLLCSIWVF